MSVIIPVILCGGSGTRLWPLSRIDRPKQFVSLTGHRTLIEDTLLRAAKIAGAGDPICVTASAHSAAVRRSLHRLGMSGRLLLEPRPRGTAPALCAAALVAMQNDPEAILVALPADHIIEDDAAFAKSIEHACEAMETSHLVVLGVTPGHPAPGFGYIMPGASFENFHHVKRVEKFIEKPSEEIARDLIERGALWNAGIVVARASAIVKAMEFYAPAVLEAVEKSLGADVGNLDKVELAEHTFSQSPNISFDKAVLENCTTVAVVSLPAVWRDVGTWDAVAELFNADPDGNSHKGRVRLSASSDNFVFSPHRLTVGVGLKDLIVVDTPDALLIANRHEMRDFREIVAAMAASRNPEVGSDDMRAGSHTGNASFGGIEMRQILLEPGDSSHCDPQPTASRYWIVLEGAVQVTIGSDTFYYGTHQSFHVMAEQACFIAHRGIGSVKLLELSIARQPTRY